MVKDHSYSETGNPLKPHGLLFPISSKGSCICTIPTDRITHAPAFVTPVVVHWLEQEIAQWVLPTGAITYRAVTTEIRYIKIKKFKNKIKGKIAPPNKTNLKSSLICWNICFDSIHFPCISKKVKLFSFFQIIKNTCTRIVILATYCNLPPNTKITFCNTNAASVFPAQDKMMHPSACTTKTIPTFKKT